MNIGFISTWFERGAAYVTKSYIDAVKDTNNVYVYARGGEYIAKGELKWDLPYITWGLRLGGTKINFKHFKKWIIQNKVEILFFNEQHEIDVLVFIKQKFPEIKMGAYIDYYKEDTLEYFNLYDFLICNTQRHYSLFKNHPQSYYVPWGTDTDLFKPTSKMNKTITFFHSVGMSKRKGTDLLLNAYIEGKIYEQSKLIIHSQLDFASSFGYTKETLNKYNIQIIQGTITAPGLYYLGDVYVYPTTLDGLGLTIYEALSCGLPVITTNNPPMNEVVNNEVGFLVDVENYHSRSDGYYWPLSICEKKSLIEGMQYYINNRSKLSLYKKQARRYALERLDLKKKYNDINNIFVNSILLNNNKEIERLIKKNRENERNKIKQRIVRMFPNRIVHLFYKSKLHKNIFNKRFWSKMK